MTSPVHFLKKYRDRLVNFEGWPGFEPLEIPLAIFDGSDTYLWRHPSPPETFDALTGEPSVHVMPGRPPGLVANSFIELNEVHTATVLCDPCGIQQSSEDWIPLIAHEAFHVHQRLRFRHPGADEVSLFVYPFDDLNLLSKRRLETYALGKALSAETKKDEAAWARAALVYRKKRFEAMAKPFVDYERGIEITEGTATYVEYTVGNRRPELPPDGFEVMHVRQRGYQTGAAFCLLLDEFVAGWQKRLETDEEANLDTLLSEALAAESSGNVVDAGVSSTVTKRAAEDIQQLLLKRKQQRAAFDNSADWQLTLISSSRRPLNLAGFDPLNIEIVEGGVLHRRYLKLASEQAQLEVLDAQCLTESHGQHPLLDGVSRVTVNLNDRPVVDEDKNGFRVLSKTVKATINLGTLKTEGRHIKIGLTGYKR